MKRYRLCRLLLALLLLVLTGCSLWGGGDSQESDESQVEEPREYPVTIGDATILSRPGSVVSLAPSVTEKFVDLGMEDRLVGISEYCTDGKGGAALPESVAALPRCGTAQLPDLDELGELSPHVVIAETALSQADADALGRMDIDVVLLERAESLESWLETYVTISRLMEGDLSGAIIGESFVRQRLRDRLDGLEEWFGAYARENGAKKALYLRYLDYTIATGETLESALMEMIGLENAAAAQTGWTYPEGGEGDGKRREDIEAADIIFMDESDVKMEDLERHEFYKGLSTVIEDQYQYIDCSAFERQSLRMLDELERMGGAAYPAAVPPAGYTPAKSEGEKDDEALPEDTQSAPSDDPMVQALENMPQATEEEE